MVTKTKLKTGTWSTKRKSSDFVYEENDQINSNLIFKYHTTIPLTGASMLDLSSDVEISEQKFRLETPTMSVIYYADSPENLISWMNDIDDQIALLFEKQISRF